MLFNEDGSLYIYLTKNNPGEKFKNNWLPTSKKDEIFALTIRCYWPKEEILNRKWIPPTLLIE